ncbi:MAG: hypothetical protein L6R30_08135 [Thermoanaerobaculia bacterium]|nr:hypothetical protein [Thermoanaerobaculia bacterium]
MGSAKKECEASLAGGLKIRVESARSALGVFRRTSPSVRCPGKPAGPTRGIELLIAARRGVPTLPVIIIAAFGTSEVRHEVMKRGSVEYLERPFSFSALLEVVDRILAARTGFSGSISLPMFPDLVQIYALSASWGALRIDRGGETGAVWSNWGHVVHAGRDHGVRGPSAG